MDLSGAHGLDGSGADLESTAAAAAAGDAVSDVRDHWKAHGNSWMRMPGRLLLPIGYCCCVKPVCIMADMVVVQSPMTVLRFTAYLMAYSSDPSQSNVCASVPFHLCVTRLHKYDAFEACLVIKNQCQRLGLGCIV